MAITFPTTLDALTNPGPTDKEDNSSVYHDVQHSDLNDIAEALEAKVGVTNSTVKQSHDSLLALKKAIEYKSGSADTPDDEFDSGSLDVKWTAVSGTSGTVSLLETSNVSKYDLSTWSGHLLMQAGPTADSKVQLRQDYTLPDTKSIIVALSCSPAAANAIANNEYWVGLFINDNDTGYDSGEWDGLFMDSEASGYRYIFYNGTTTSGQLYGPSLVGHRVYLRLHRNGTSINAFVSYDGMMWIPLGVRTRAATATNVWLVTEAVATADTPVPIQAFDWIRLGGAGVKPW